MIVMQRYNFDWAILHTMLKLFTSPLDGPLEKILAVVKILLVQLTLYRTQVLKTLSLM